MPDDEHSSGADDVTKKRKYNMIAQREYRKLGWSYTSWFQTEALK
jgi:hypothetical protein